MTSTFFFCPRGGSFLHSPRSRLARFEGRGEKLFIVSLMALAGILRERVAVLSKLFMRIVPKYLGTLTFSLNFRNIKWREGERAFARSFVRSDAATTNTGRSRFVYFRFEPRMRHIGVGRRSRTICQGRRWRRGAFHKPFTQPSALSLLLEISFKIKC